MDWLALEGRAAVVTGAGGGIGRATAVSLAAAGCRVALLDRDERALRDTSTEIDALGRAALACDVSDPGSVERAAARSFEAFGPCDVLVNNAGLLRPGPLETLSIAEWNTLLAVNLTGYFVPARPQLSHARALQGQGCARSTWHEANSSASSGRTGPARRPCSTS